jgi:hypothetical protein
MRSHRSLFTAITLIEAGGACAVLAFAGSVSSAAGVALWPGVGLHAGMAVWCAVSLRTSLALR